MSTFQFVHWFGLDFVFVSVVASRFTCWLFYLTAFCSCLLAVIVLVLVSSVLSKTIVSEECLES